MSLRIVILQSLLFALNVGLTAYNLGTGNISQGAFNAAVAAFTLPFAILAVINAANE